MSLQNIFPTPIYTHFVPQPIANKIEEIIVPELNNLPLHDNLYTEFFLQKQIINPLKTPFFFDYLNHQLLDYSKKSNIRASKIIQGWIQNYKQNSSQDIHTHPFCAISGTYYIRANKHAGELVFHSPNPYKDILPPIDIDNKDSEVYKIKPKKGLLVLFPSWLKHQIIPSPEKDIIRTSFSFNCI